MNGQPVKMAPIYADHPFPLLQTPVFLANNKGEKVCNPSHPTAMYFLRLTTTQPDMFDKIASEMAHVHNMLIRGLNSIILQAPHIKSADEKAFCKYIMGWYNLLHSHHSGEEAIFFPTVERMAGTKGIMDTNIDQHKAFHDGVDELKGYAQAVVADQEKYAGTKVVSLIDRFGNPLIQHLADEIPTILSLRQYGEEKMAGLPNEFDAEGDKAMVGVIVCSVTPSQYANILSRESWARLAWFGPSPTSI